MINVKAALKQGELIEAYNNWNKKFHIPVKGIGSLPNSFQLMPDTRALVPTGLKLNVPTGHLLKLYTDSNAVLQRGLTIAAGVQNVKPGEDQELYVIMRNITDSLVVIADGDVLAEGFLQKIIDKDVIVV
jgi:dUTPase